MNVLSPFKGADISVPLTGFEPDHAFEAVHCVAFVVFQVIETLEPVSTDPGVAAIDNVGDGGGSLTTTTAVA